MLPRPRDLWLWMITVLDDVFVEKFWYRLKRGDVRGAARSIGELFPGFPGCWLAIVVLAVLGILLLRAI
jgi:hypothetical protein